MIDVIVSNSCPHCHVQLDIMLKNFAAVEYRIIKEGTKEFDGYDLNAHVDAFPFVVVRNSSGIKYAAHGIVGAEDIRRMARKRKPFNLNRRHSQ